MKVDKFVKRLRNGSHLGLTFFNNYKLLRQITRVSPDGRIVYYTGEDINRASISMAALIENLRSGYFKPGC